MWRLKDAVGGSPQLATLNGAPSTFFPSPSRPRRLVAPTRGVIDRARAVSRRLLVCCQACANMRGHPGSSHHTVHAETMNGGCTSSRDVCVGMRDVVMRCHQTSKGGRFGSSTRTPAHGRSAGRWRQPGRCVET
jgi:hypothetical protein